MQTFHPAGSFSLRLGIREASILYCFPSCMLLAKSPNIHARLYTLRLPYVICGIESSCKREGAAITYVN